MLGILKYNSLENHLIKWTWNNMKNSSKWSYHFRVENQPENRKNESHSNRTEKQIKHQKTG